jgi:hypothetical protein
MKSEDYERQLEWIKHIKGESIWSELKILVKVVNDKLVIAKEYEGEVRSRISPEYANTEIVFK